MDYNNNKKIVQMQNIWNQLCSLSQLGSFHHFSSSSNWSASSSRHKAIMFTPSFQTYNTYQSMNDSRHSPWRWPQQCLLENGSAYINLLISNKLEIHKQILFFYSVTTIHWKPYRIGSPSVGQIWPLLVNANHLLHVLKTGIIWH